MPQPTAENRKKYNRRYYLKKKEELYNDRSKHCIYCNKFMTNYQVHRLTAGHRKNKIIYRLQK